MIKEGKYQIGPNIITKKIEVTPSSKETMSKPDSYVGNNWML